MKVAEAQVILLICLCFQKFPSWNIYILYRFVRFISLLSSTPPQISSTKKANPLIAEFNDPKQRYRQIPLFQKPQIKYIQLQFDMLVREVTKEIQISMDNKVVSVTRDEKEYTYKRKIYDFNELQDDQEERKSETLTFEKKPKRGRSRQLQNEGQPQRREKGQNETKSLTKDSQDFQAKKEWKASAKYYPNQKKQSYFLLKFLGAILIILIAMTIFKQFFPDSQYNLLRLFNASNPKSISMPLNQNDTAL